MKLHRTTEYVDKKIADLERELAGTQEMLGHVLKQIGEPVVVPKASLHEGLGEKTQIRVDDNFDLDAFVFSLEVADD